MKECKIRSNQLCMCTKENECYNDGQQCGYAIEKKCERCEYLVDGKANDEACAGCYEDTKEHKNFKYKGVELK